MNERQRLLKIRNQKGAAVTGLVLALFFFIMLVGFFAFDSSRIQMAQRELTATCDSASLAGTAMLTSYPTDNDDASHTKLQFAQGQACAYARNMFQAGNLLGQGLSGANVVGTYAAVGVTGAPGSTNVMIALADPTNNYAGVPPGPATCVNGKAIMCYACYTYTPVFLSIVGVTTVGLNAASGGGLPQVDAVLVFDFSGSMDDATNVSFIRRTWDSSITSAGLNSGAASYNAVDHQRVVLPAPGGLAYPGKEVNLARNGTIHYIEITPPTTSHRLSDVLQHNYTNNPNGLNLNVLPPCNIDLASNPDSQTSPHFTWDQNLRINYNPYKAALIKVGSIPAHTAGAVWTTDYGTPPGNCTLDPPYGYGAQWNPTMGDPKMYCSGTASPNNAGAATNTCMAYRTDQRHPITGTGPDSIYMTNPDCYSAIDYANVGAYREFTDLVVNIADPGSWPYNQPLAGPSSFVGFNVTFPAQEPDTTLAGQTFNFEDLGVVVEASRGNLDASANARGALLDRTCYFTIPENGVIKQASAVNLAHVATGYQKAYQRLAMLFSQPIATAVDGADGGFFQKINSLCDCRFGFVGFSNANTLTVGSSPNSTTVGTDHGTTAGSTNSFYLSTQYSAVPSFKFYWNGAQTAAAQNNVSVAGGIGSGFRQPRRALKKTETQANSVNGVDGSRLNASFTGGVTAGYSAPWSSEGADADGLDNGRPVDHTDTYEAINTARYMFHDGANYNIASITQSRPAAKHAIVFFTDGVPTGGVGGSDASSSLTVAQACKTDGIAIYTIGMDVTNNPILQSAQVVFLGNATSGLAGASGNGGRFFQCTNSGTVKQAFNAVARRLAQSQR